MLHPVCEFDQLQDYIYDHQEDTEKLTELQMAFPTTMIPPNECATNVPTTLFAKFIDELGLAPMVIAEPVKFNLKTIHEIRRQSLEPPTQALTGDLTVIPTGLSTTCFEV